MHGKPKTEKPLERESGTIPLWKILCNLSHTTSCRIHVHQARAWCSIIDTQALFLLLRRTFFLWVMWHPYVFLLVLYRLYFHVLMLSFNLSPCLAHVFSHVLPMFVLVNACFQVFSIFGEVTWLLDFHYFRVWRLTKRRNMFGKCFTFTCSVTMLISATWKLFL